MDIKELEQIISILKHSDVSELELDRDGTHIRISRGPRQVVSAAAPVNYQIVEPAIVAGGSSNGAQHAAPSHTPAENNSINPNFVKIESPIVGTFYSKPSPDAESFVKVGDRVKKGSTVCIIEAMKLMNEIEAPCDGKIEKVLLSDGKVVEFGEVLFFINPSA